MAPPCKLKFPPQDMQEMSQGFFETLKISLTPPIAVLLSNLVLEMVIVIVPPLPEEGGGTKMAPAYTSMSHRRT